MTQPAASPLVHFEALYAASDDPWQVRASWYERRKRELLLASLDRDRYGKVFEPGCGNGEMSASLARRCDALLACDGAASAVAAAVKRVGQVAGCEIRIEQRSLPAGWPRGENFDLIVISELAYYFDAADVNTMAEAVQSTLTDGGLVILCDSRHHFADRVTSTEDVHAAFDKLPQLRRRLRHLEDDFLLEAWTRSAA